MKREAKSKVTAIEVIISIILVLLIAFTLVKLSQAKQEQQPLGAPPQKDPLCYQFADSGGYIGKADYNAHCLTATPDQGAESFLADKEAQDSCSYWAWGRFSKEEYGYCIKLYQKYGIKFNEFGSAPLICQQDYKVASGKKLVDCVIFMQSGFSLKEYGGDLTGELAYTIGQRRMYNHNPQWDIILYTPSSDVLFSARNVTIVEKKDRLGCRSKDYATCDDNKLIGMGWTFDKSNQRLGTPIILSLQGNKIGDKVTISKPNVENPTYNLEGTGKIISSTPNTGIIEWISHNIFRKETTYSYVAEGTVNITLSKFGTPTFIGKWQAVKF